MCMLVSLYHSMICSESGVNCAKGLGPNICRVTMGLHAVEQVAAVHAMARFAGQQEAMDETMRSDKALPLLDAAADKFAEVTISGAPTAPAAPPIARPHSSSPSPSPWLSLCHAPSVGGQVPSPLPFSPLFHLGSQRQRALRQVPIPWPRSAVAELTNRNPGVVILRISSIQPCDPCSRIMEVIRTRTTSVIPLSQATADWYRNEDGAREERTWIAPPPPLMPPGMPVVTRLIPLKLNHLLLLRAS